MGCENDGAEPRVEGEAERALRSSRLVVVKCKREYGPEVSVKIRNTSATGLRGDCAEVADFRTGEPVRLLFRNIAPIAAGVAWCENGQVAFTFGTAIDIDRVVSAHSRQALPEPSPRSETTRNWIDRANNDRAYTRAKLGVAAKRPV